MSRKVDLRTRAMVANWLGACRRLTNREHPQKRRAYRWTFAIVAMAVGAVIGGSFLRADVPQVATGSWMEMQSGPFGDALPGAASAVLPDGKVVVAGGQLADGSFTGAVVLYDPALGEWKSAGTLIEPRAGLSAAALADGHVVFAGGRTAAGMAASVEVFDPQAGSSQLAGEMMLRRADAAAATLPDGRVLIAGGTDGAGPLAAAELFDPVTGTSQFAASLAVARAGLSATTLLDGHVLVAGGNDGHNDVAMAEIYDPELGFFWETESMNTPRSRHVAMRLPGSNTVLVAGGMSNGVALKSAEQYAHWGQLWLAYEPLMSVARVGAVAAPTARPGVVVIGGGGDPRGEYYGYATVGTDKDDYAPYETVTISGSGWQPGETVHLRVSEDSDSHYDWELEATADESGSIFNQDFYPRNDEVYHHVGMRFYLTGVGIASQAQATFTDANQTNTSLSSAPNPSTAGQNVTLTATIRGGNSQGSGPLVTEGTVEFYDQTTAQKNDCSKNGVLLGSRTVNASGQASLVVAFPSGGTYPIQACYIGTHGQGTQDSSSLQITQTVNSAIANTTTTASNVSATFSGSDQNVTLGATVTSTSTVNAGTITFTVKNGAVTIGSPVSANVLSGSASQTFVLPGNTPAGTYSIQAAFGGAPGFNSSNDTTKILTVGRANQAAVTLSAPVSATYGQTGLSAVAAGGSSTGAYSYSHGSSTACTVNSTTGALTITSGTGICAITATRAGDANFNPSTPSAPASVTISKAAATISVTGYTGVYDGNAHGATGTAKGVNGEDLTGLNLGATFTNVPGGTANWTFTDVTGNYNNATGTAAILITKADAVVTVNGYSGVYDGNAHGATGTAKGVKSENLVGLSLGATFTNVPGGTANWTFTDTTGNYNNASGTAAIVLTKADATIAVTGYTGVYDGEAHGATGTVKGVKNEPLTGLALGASFTNVPGGTGNWTFTDVTGNYNSANGTAAVVISKADAVVTVNGFTGVYDGNPHGATGTAKGVKNEDLTGLNLGAQFTGVPGGTASWTFTDATGNYNNASGTAAIVISKADAVVTVNGYTGVYDGNAHGATGSAKGVKGEDLTGLNLGQAFTDVPGGTASWTFTDTTGNYNNVNGTAAILISKADAAVTVDGYTGVYDGNAHGAAGSAKGVKSEALSGLTLGATFINVPGGTAHWTFTDVTGNYKDASGDAGIIINKANAIVTVDGYTGVYDGNAHGAMGSAAGVKGEALMGLVLGDSFTNVPGGTANWTFTDVTGNYNNAGGTAAIVLTKADATIAVTGYTGVYDGEAHGATGTVKGVKNEPLTGLALGASFTNVPGGTANWTFTDVTGNYNNAGGTAAIVLTKADATIAVNGYTGVYDGAAHGATGLAKGIGGVTLSGLDLGATFTNVPGGTANWAFTDVTGNYNNTSGTAVIAISKADATVTVNGYAGVYDGNAHGATGSATGVNGEALTGLVLGDSFTNVPGGTAHWTFAGGTNYTDQSGDVTIAINKADATVTVTGYTATYDGTAHGASGSATGVGGVTLTGLDLGAKFTNVPGGTAHWTFSGGTNYKDQSGDVAIVINKADATVTVTGYTGTYDGSEHGGTGSAKGVGGVTLSGLDLGAKFTNVPGGTAHWTFAGGTNYTDQSGDVAIVINKADATVTVMGYTGTYDGNAHGATGSATGVGAVALTGLDLGAKFTNVPGGTAHWTFTNANYADQAGDVAIAITKADAVVTVTGYSGKYDGNAHGATGNAKGVNQEPLTGLDLGATFTNVPGGTTHWTFTNANYAYQAGDVAIAIAKAEAVVTVTGYTGKYDGQAHGATGSAKGVNNETLTGFDFGNSFIDVPGGTAHWTFTNTNYADQAGDVAITIAKADAVVTVTGYSGKYDGQAHGATGSAKGVNQEPLTGLDIGASFTTVPGGTAHWTFTNANYADQAGDVAITIAKADAIVTVTGYSGSTTARRTAPPARRRASTRNRSPALT